ncbi:hypothetical protein [Oceanobacillus senegalensis]|nr:hypothetical protein [Oceanobacillus senegalensis]
MEEKPIGGPCVILGKMIPLAGGIIGGTFDGISTNVIRGVAKNYLLEK